MHRPWSLSPNACVRTGVATLKHGVVPLPSVKKYRTVHYRLQPEVSITDSSVGKDPKIGESKNGSVQHPVNYTVPR